jgi:hypothetical protein
MGCRDAARCATPRSPLCCFTASCPAPVDCNQEPYCGGGKGLPWWRHDAAAPSWLSANGAKGTPPHAIPNLHMTRPITNRASTSLPLGTADTVQLYIDQCQLAPSRCSNTRCERRRGTRKRTCAGFPIPCTCLLVLLVSAARLQLLGELTSFVRGMLSSVWTGPRISAQGACKSLHHPAFTSLTFVLSCKACTPCAAQPACAATQAAAAAQHIMGALVRPGRQCDTIQRQTP